MFEFALVSLAAFRLAYLVAEEDGPGRMFLNFRRWAHKNLYPYFDAECAYCTGIWIALPFAFILDTTWFVIVYWLAIAAMVSLLVSTIHKIQE